MCEAQNLTPKIAFQGKIEICEFKVVGSKAVNVYEASQHLFAVILIRGEQINAIILINENKCL